MFVLCLVYRGSTAKRQNRLIARGAHSNSAYHSDGAPMTIFTGHIAHPDIYADNAFSLGQQAMDRGLSANVFHVYSRNSSSARFAKYGVSEEGCRATKRNISQNVKPATGRTLRPCISA